MTQGVSGRAAEQDQRTKNSALLLKSLSSFQIISFCWTHFTPQYWYNINTNISSHNQFMLLDILIDSFVTWFSMGGQNELRMIPIDSMAAWLYDSLCTGNILLQVHLSGPGLQVLSDDWMYGKTEPYTLPNPLCWITCTHPCLQSAACWVQEVRGGVKRRASWEHTFGSSLISISWSPTNWQLLFSDVFGEMKASSSCPLRTDPRSRLPFLCQNCPLGDRHLHRAHATLSLIASTSPGRNWLNRKIINAWQWQCWWSPQTQVSEYVSKGVLPGNAGVASWDKWRLTAQNPYLLPGEGKWSPREMGHRKPLVLPGSIRLSCCERKGPEKFQWGACLCSWVPRG